MEQLAWALLMFVWRLVPQSQYCPIVAVRLHTKWKQRRVDAQMQSYVEVDFEELVLDSEYQEAVLFRIDGEKVWIPRKCLLGGGYTQDSQGGGSFEIPEKLAIEKGLV